MKQHSQNCYPTISWKTFNADEFGLFYQCLPFKTYHLSRKKCSRGKNSKVRLTGMEAAGATGEKLESPRSHGALRM